MHVIEKAGDIMNDLLHNKLRATQHGWTKDTDGAYSIDWEDPDEIRGTIDFLIKGCACKKDERAIDANEKGDYCGPGCECQGCVNIPIYQPQTASSVSDTIDDEDGSLRMKC